MSENLDNIKEFQDKENLYTPIIIPKQKLSTNERLLLLESKIDFIYEFLVETDKIQENILEGITKLVEQNKSNDKNLNEWIKGTNNKLNKLMIQHANLSFIFNTLFPLSDEQKKILKEKAEELKSIKSRED